MGRSHKAEGEEGNGSKGCQLMALVWVFNAEILWEISSPRKNMTFWSAMFKENNHGHVHKLGAFSLRRLDPYFIISCFPVHSKMLGSNRWNSSGWAPKSVESAPPEHQLHVLAHCLAINPLKNYWNLLAEQHVAKHYFCSPPLAAVPPC